MLSIPGYINIPAISLANIIANASDETIGIGLFIVTVICFYWMGHSVAGMDKRAGLADTDLPVWIRRILFIKHPNPFRKKTIVYQSFVVIALLIVLGVSLIFPPDTRIGAIILGVYCVATLIVALVCDLQLRRKIPGEK